MFRPSCSDQKILILILPALRFSISFANQSSIWDWVEAAEKGCAKRKFIEGSCCAYTQAQANAAVLMAKLAIRANLLLMSPPLCAASHDFLYGMPDVVSQFIDKRPSGSLPSIKDLATEER